MSLWTDSQLRSDDEAARERLLVLATEARANDPVLVERARQDPITFADAFCWGVDYEKNPPVIFKTRLWPWQRRLLARLAWGEPLPLPGEVPANSSVCGEGTAEGCNTVALLSRKATIPPSDPLSPETPTDRPASPTRGPDLAARAEPAGQPDPAPGEVGLPRAGGGGGVPGAGAGGRGGPRAPARVLALKTRGAGATWAAVWYLTWLLWARGPGQVLVESDTELKSWALMKRHKFVVERLAGGVGYPGVKGGGQDSLSVREYENGSEIYSLSGDPEGIRSFHPTFVLIDEAAQFGQDFRAPLMGLKSDVVIQSTANGYGNAFAEMALDALNNGGREWGYELLFVPWFWRPDLKERPRGGEALQRQEFPESPGEAFVTSGRGYFDQAALEILEAREGRKPLEIEDSGRLVIWKEPEAGRAYVIGADVAEGHESGQEGGTAEGVASERGGADFSCAVVRDWLTGEQVAEWHGRIGEIAFAHKLQSLLMRYPGMVVVERNNTGALVCHRLLELTSAGEVFHDRKDRRPGWRTRAESKILALGHLAQAINRRELAMRSFGFWGEARVYQAEGGRLRAPAGYHDDRVMATAISEAVRQEVAAPAVGMRGKALPPMPSYARTWDRGAPGWRPPTGRRVVVQGKRRVEEEAQVLAGTGGLRSTVRDGEEGGGR